MPLHNPKAVPRPQGPSQRPKPVRLDSLKNPQPRSIPLHAPPASAKRSDRISVCTVAGCQSTELGEDNGYLVCQTCGTILQETNIVSDNTFIETGGGESMRAGVTVANDASRARVYDPVSARIAGGMSSRELSEANGRHAIRAVAGHPLNIVQDMQDSAMQVYKLALANNFVQGRQTKTVAAVCLYIACRRSRENNKWMLIDLADKCGINVFKLGMTFKALLGALHLSGSIFGTLEPIHVESLILRFAEQMGFGRAKQRIANEAVRIVQQMRRDWMTHGRRPAGLCGAALLLAARMNNFRRTVREVVYIVKVAEVTVSKRLDEFQATESSGLTVAQFRETDDLPGAADPPAFQNKKMAKSKAKAKAKVKTKAKAKVKERQKHGKKRKAVIEIEDDSDNTEAESGQEESATPPSRQTRRKKSKAAIEIEDTDTTETDSERAASVLSSLVDVQLRTPTNSQAQRDRQSMPPPQRPIDPALLHISSVREDEHQMKDAGTIAGAVIRSRGRPPGKTQPPAEPSDSDLQHEQRLETQIEDILNDEENISIAEHAHKNPDAPGIESGGRSTSDESSPSQTHLGSAATLAAQPYSPSVADSQARISAPPDDCLADDRSLSRRSESILSSLSSIRSSHSPSSNSRSTHSSSRSPSPPPKRRRTVRPVQLITSTSTTQPLLDRVPSSEIIPDEEFADDIDIANCLLSQQESTIKERLWVNANSDYLRAFQAKFLKQQLAEQNGTARKAVKRKRRKPRMGDLSGVYDERGPPKDAGEAVERMMKKRAFSKKINYKLIGDTYGGSRRGSEASTTTGAPAGSQAGSQEGSRGQSAAPTTVLGPDGEIIVEGGHTPAAEVLEVRRPGDTRDEAIEVEDVESDADDYYDDEDEIAGVGEVVNEVVEGIEDEDMDDEDG